MKFRQLAVSNIRGNWHQYSAFFLSSVFSVMIFFIYAAFIFHPDDYIQEEIDIHEVMVACEYVIMVFSFFFILYSMSAFVKSRKKELGLYSLFGMTNGQIRKLVLYENMTIALLAICTGIVLGTLFSKLFFMALAEILHVSSPIRFAIPVKALMLTGVGFLALFLVITLFTLFQIGRSPIIDLLKVSKKPKTSPMSSKWLVLLSTICLGAGYYMAFNMDEKNLIYFLLILFLVIFGTYLLFMQGSVAILRRLQRRTSLYYKGTNLITVSQLVFKMKDNARMLFMVSMMSAVILTAPGMFYVIHQVDSKAQLHIDFPQTISFYEEGLNTHNVVDLEKFRQILKEDGVDIDYESKLAGIAANFPIIGNPNSKESIGLIIKQDDYNKLAAKMNQQQLVIKKDHAVYVFPDKDVQTLETGVPLTVKANGLDLNLVIDGHVTSTIVSLPRDTGEPSGLLTGLLVVDNEQHKAIMNGVPGDKQIVVYSFELKNWERAGKTAAKIEALVPEEQRSYFANRVVLYDSLINLSFSLTLFIGLFISFLFFIASGSMIYFKLFTELEEDREQFRALTRIGITVREISKTVTTQIAMVFYIPCVVGIVHTMLAMKVLGNLMKSSAWLYVLVVVGSYIVTQSIGFLTARRSYLNEIVKG